MAYLVSVALQLVKTGRQPLKINGRTEPFTQLLVYRAVLVMHDRLQYHQAWNRQKDFSLSLVNLLFEKGEGLSKSIDVVGELYDLILFHLVKELFATKCP